MDGTAACTRCLQPLEAGVAHCGHCGAPAARPNPHGVEQASPDMTTAEAWRGRIPLCLGCGAVAPLEQSRCAVCQHRFESPRPYVAAAQDETLWALVQTSFECRACGHRSPINHLDVDGTALCLSCGIEQRFETQQWWDALAHAHAVADLAGPSPDGLLGTPDAPLGRDNPHAAVGLNLPFSDHQHDDDQRLELRAAPGWPLCSKCCSPLGVSARDEQGMTMRCATCEQERRYALPPKLSQRASRLVGIIGDEHELGRKDAQLREENGVSALRCPTCGAALTVTGASTIVTCSYCSNACRVHPRALPKAGRGTAAALPFWLLFRGPSPARQKLVKRQQHAAEQAAGRAKKDAARERSRAQQPAIGSAAPPTRRDRRAKRPAWVDWVAIAGTIAGSLAFGLWMNSLEEKRELEQKTRLERAAREQVERNRRAQEEAAAERVQARAKERGSPFSFSVPMDAVKVEGQMVAPGEPCTIAVEGAGDSIDHLLVQCQKAVLYDSMTQVTGMRMLAFELYRSEPSAAPQGLRYSDTGQRSNGSEVSIDTQLGQAAAWSQVVPIFRVELGPHREKPRAKSKAKPPVTRP